MEGYEKLTNEDKDWIREFVTLVMGKHIETYHASEVKPEDK